jgi:chromosome segregation ATPase
MIDLAEFFESIIDKYGESRAKMIEYKLKYESLESKIQVLETKLTSAKAEIQLLNETISEYEYCKKINENEK